MAQTKSTAHSLHGSLIVLYVSDKGAVFLHELETFSFPNRDMRSHALLHLYTYYPNKISRSYVFFKP